MFFLIYSLTSCFSCSSCGKTTPGTKALIPLLSANKISLYSSLTPPIHLIQSVGLLSVYKVLNLLILFAVRLFLMLNTLWCPRTNSNREPTDYKSVALPVELQGHKYFLSYLFYYSTIFFKKFK